MGISVAHRASFANRVFWELKGHISPSGSTTAGDSLSKSIPIGCVNLHYTCSSPNRKMKGLLRGTSDFRHKDISEG